MHNIKFIRENPQEFDQLMFRRGLRPISSKIISIDTLIRNDQTLIQNIQEKRNIDSKNIGMMISQGKNASELQKNVSSLKIQLTKLDEKIKSNLEKLNLVCFLDFSVMLFKTSLPSLILSFKFFIQTLWWFFKSLKASLSSESKFSSHSFNSSLY